MAASITLLDRFKALNTQGINLQNQKMLLQQQLDNTQQALTETTGGIKLLLEMDPTLTEQFNKEQLAAQKKASEAPVKS